MILSSCFLGKNGTFSFSPVNNKEKKIFPLKIWLNFCGLKYISEGWWLSEQKISKNEFSSSKPHWHVGTKLQISSFFFQAVKSLRWSWKMRLLLIVQVLYGKAISLMSKDCLNVQNSKSRESKKRESDEGEDSPACTSSSKQSGVCCHCA